MKYGYFLFYLLSKSMKKNTIKAFTLVEMLIVIVIIGILIAALLPRMNAAQWRARDVARKTALSQIQSAIVTYQWDYGRWPWTSTLSGNPAAPIQLSEIQDKLINAWMTDVPGDPLGTKVEGMWWQSTDGSYLYLVWTRNWTEMAWFALMAKTEVAWGSNRVICDGQDDKITTAGDLKDVHPCTSVQKTDDTNTSCNNPNGSGEDNTCYFEKESELRYIVLY